MKRVRTRSSDVASVREAPRTKGLRVRTKSSDLNGLINGDIAESPTSETSSTRSPKPGGRRQRTKSSDVNGLMTPRSGSQTPVIERVKSLSVSDANVNANYSSSKFTLKVLTHGRVGGPLPEPDDENGEVMLKFNVRDVANPPAKLRKTHTGLSPRFRKEVFSDKSARLKYDLMVSEIEKMMNQIETGANFDVANATQVDPDDESPKILIVGIQCEEGKHRSVSFAEELIQSGSVSRKDWGIVVEHRDLGLKNSNVSDAGDDEGEEEEPPTPTVNVMERTKTQKKRDKNMKKARDKRMQVEAIGVMEADGYF